jgi:hypothetical protein
MSDKTEKDAELRLIVQGIPSSLMVEASKYVKPFMGGENWEELGKGELVVSLGQCWSMERLVDVVERAGFIVKGKFVVTHSVCAFYIMADYPTNFVVFDRNKKGDGA